MLEGLSFKVADPQEVARALELRRQIYTRDLGHHGMDSFDADAHHLIAQDATGQIIAALRILGPDQRPLEIEQFINLPSIVPSCRLPAQIGGFWVRQDHRRVSRNPFVQMGMLKLAHLFAHRNAVTDFLMYTYPHLVPLYKSAYFKSLDLQFEHPAWGVVQVMHLDLLTFERDYSQSTEPMARLLFATDLPNFAL